MCCCHISITPVGQVNPSVSNVKVIFYDIHDFVHLLDKGRGRLQSRPSRGAFFILQLHDELLYEVVEEDVIQVCRLLYKRAKLRGGTNGVIFSIV